ncbi:MAG TPA: hypothetical protein VGC84_11975 [Ilumatobacteraceae bacterium]|jgi:hypothetical protein
MKKFVLALVAVLTAMIGSLGISAVAEATPTASFTMSTTSPVVNQLVTFNGSSSVCDTATCSYTWSWTFRTSGGATLNGGQMGTGKVISYRFSSFAASKPFITVKLKVTNSGSTHNFALASTSFVVRAA